MPRSVGVDELRKRELGGIYVIRNPKIAKTFYKVGMSEDDIERRISDYAGYYPNGFYVDAVLLYRNDYEKYYKVRDAESELHRFLKDYAVKRYPGQRKTEWFALKNKKQQKALFDKMKEIANSTGGVFTYYGDSHDTNIPK